MLHCPDKQHQYVLFCFCVPHTRTYLHVYIRMYHMGCERSNTSPCTVSLPNSLVCAFLWLMCACTYAMHVTNYPYFLPVGCVLRMHRRRLTCVQSARSARQALHKCSLARTRRSPSTTCLARTLLRVRSTGSAQRSLLRGE